MAISLLQVVSAVWMLANAIMMRFVSDGLYAGPSIMFASGCSKARAAHPHPVHVILLLETCNTTQQLGGCESKTSIASAWILGRANVDV